MLIRRLCATAGALVALAVPAAAHADSIVYLKDGNVWIAQPDGSGARQFTLYQYGWASPSEADDGTVVAAGGLLRNNPDGTDSDGSDQLFRFAPDGNQVGGPIPTWGSYSSPACPYYPPTSVRVSPDGSKIAYGILECAGMSYTTLWTPSNSTSLNFPNQSQGQTDFYEPAWIDSTHFLVSHAGDTITSTQNRWFVHDVAAGDDVGTGWYEPTMSADGAQGVISRDGTKLVVITDDGASYLDGKPQHVALWVFTAANLADAEAHAWHLACSDKVLDAATSSHPPYSLSLSPDGTKMLWGDDKGVEVASLANLTSNCASVTPVLLVPGGAQPFYGKGNLAPGAANPTQPGAPAPPPSNGGTTGGTPGGGAGGTTTTTTAGPTGPPAVPKPLAVFKITTKHALVGHAVTFDAGKSAETGGAIKSYSWNFGDHHKGKGRKVKHKYRKAGKYTVTLTVTDAKGVKATKKAKLKVTRH